MTHISNIESLATRLKDIGVAIDDQQVITKILCTVPPSFRHAVSVWDRVPDTDRTIALLTAHLLKEETMNQMYYSSEASDSAFFLRRNGGQKRGDRRGSFSGHNRPKQQTKCNLCGRSNHLEKDCWSAARRKTDARVSTLIRLQVAGIAMTMRLLPFLSPLRTLFLPTRHMPVIGLPTPAQARI